MILRRVVSMFVRVCDHFLSNVHFHTGDKGEILPAIAFGRRPQWMLPSLFSNDRRLIYSSPVEAFLEVRY